MRIGRGSMLAAASIAMILSPFSAVTPPSSMSRRTKRGLVNCTGVMKRKNSSTARSARLQSSSQPVAQPGILQQLVHAPLMRCVVVSWPANSSRNTIATISSRLIFRPPSRPARSRRSAPRRRAGERFRDALR